MYAIIETGGKQYRVQEGDTIDVELLKEDSGKGVSFTSVIAYGDKIGAPYVDGCTVVGELIGEAQGDKVYAFKYKRRKDSKRRVGHRQKYSRVKITKISMGGK